MDNPDHGPGYKKASNWLLLTGILLIFLASVAIASSFTATLAAILLLGVLLVMAGVVQVSYALVFRSYEFMWRLSSGILYLLTGLLLVLEPVRAAIGLTFLLALMFLGGSILRIMAAMEVKRITRKNPVIHYIIAALNLLLAALLISGMPETGKWAIGLFLGIELLFGGITLIAMSLKIRELGGLFED